MFYNVVCIQHMMLSMYTRLMVIMGAYSGVIESDAINLSFTLLLPGGDLVLVNSSFGCGRACFCSLPFRHAALTII
jgi:hypothetical protein